MKRMLWTLLSISCCLILSGCRPELKTGHGTVQQPSINGLGLFVDLLRAGGHRVDVMPAVSERLYRYDTVIVFHNGLSGIQEETVKFLREFGDYEQTIVFAFRNGDWAPDYWEAVGRQLEADHPKEAEAARQAAITARYQAVSELPLMKQDEDAFGFKLEYTTRQREDYTTKVQYFPSDGGSEEELDVDFPRNRRLQIPPETSGQEPPEVLWRAGDEPLLVTQQLVRGPRVLVLGTTAPLLNAGMLKPGNYQLAELLLEELDRSQPIAVVTSSYFLDNKDEASMWRLAKIFPHPWIFSQSLLAMVLFCWWCWPIFGRPYTDQVQNTKRFGHHVSAVGELLATTGKVKFALQCLHEWQRVSQEHRKGRRG